MRRTLALPLVLVTLAMLGLPAAATAAPQGEPIDGGPAPTQSTAVQAGTAYADDIRPGEARWFSVDLDAGQQLGATLTEYGETEYGCCLKIALSDTDFDPIANDNSINSDGTAQTLRAETNDDGVDDSGTYYFSVELDSTTAKRPVAFDFAVDVAGEGMLSSSPSPTASPTPSTTAAPSSSPTVAASAGTDAGGGSSGDATVSNPLTASAGLWAVVGVLTVLLVVLLALVAVLVRRLGSLRSKP